MDARQWISVQDWPSPMEGQRLAAQQDMAMARAPLGRHPDQVVPDKRTGTGARGRPGRRW